MPQKSPAHEALAELAKDTGLDFNTCNCALDGDFEVPMIQLRGPGPDGLVLQIRDMFSTRRALVAFLRALKGE